MNKKILIVDDQPEIRQLITITVGDEYEIIAAKDGTSALEAIRTHRPKAVLLDIMMPGEIDGLQVLHTIKSDPKTKDILVALVTARGPNSSHRATTTGWSGQRTPTVWRAAGGPPRSTVNPDRLGTTSVSGPGQNRAAN